MHVGVQRSLDETDEELRKRVMATIQRPQPMSMPSFELFKNEFDGLTDSQFLESAEEEVKIVKTEPPSRIPTHDWWAVTPPEPPPRDPRPPAHTNVQGCKVRCPWCDSGKVEAEFVDVGVGHQQVTGHLCHTCGAYELGQNVDLTTVTEAEQRIGWTGPDPRYLWDNWEDCADSRCMTDHVCEACKLKLWGVP